MNCRAPHLAVFRVRFFLLCELCVSALTLLFLIFHLLF